MIKKFTIIALAFGLCFSAFAQDTPDAAVVQKIRKEGLENSKVMDIAFHLTDVTGPRLTASPGFKTYRLSSAWTSTVPDRSARTRGLPEADTPLSSEHKFRRRRSRCSPDRQIRHRMGSLHYRRQDPHTRRLFHRSPGHRPERSRRNSRCRCRGGN